MDEQEMMATLARLHIVPSTHPVMTKLGMEWRRAIGDQGYAVWRRSHSNSLDKIHERDLLDALLAARHVELKTGLISIEDAVRILNAYLGVHYPDLDVTYSRNVLNVQAYNEVIPVYKPPRLKIGKPNRKVAYYDWRDVFTLAEKHINPHVSIARRRKKEGRSLGVEHPPDHPLVPLLATS